MKYNEYMDQITNLVVVRDDDRARIVPDYRYQIHQFETKPSDIEDFEGCTYEDVYEDLKMFVHTVNDRTDPVHDIAKWIAKVINSEIEPKITQEETELLNTLIEYMKTKKTEGSGVDIKELFPEMDFEKKDLQ